MDSAGQSTAPIKDESTSPPALHNVHLHREDKNTIAEAAAVAADEALHDEVKSEHEIPIDEATALAGLTENVRDQDDLERDITNRANLAMIEQEDERDQKRIDKVNEKIDKLERQKHTQRRKLDTLINNPIMRQRCLTELERINADIKLLKEDIEDIQGRIHARHQFDGAENGTEDAAGGNKRMPNETQREFLIRTGKITPFSKMPVRESDSVNKDLTEALMDAEEEAEREDVEEIIEEAEQRSHQILRLPGFTDVPESVVPSTEAEFGLRPRKKRRLDEALVAATTKPRRSPAEEDNFTPGISDEDEEDFVEDDDDILMTSRTTKRKANGKGKVEEKLDLAGIDDGDENMYQSRLRSWVEKRSAARRRKLQQNEATEEEQAAEAADEDECFKPCPDGPDHHFDNGLKLPGDIYPALFDYQKTGVQWLGELYSQQVGGIVGDEMGLGKTIQIISFLAGLHYSKKLTKPIIVVAPATVLRQWVNEFHRWWPPLRVSILHSSGSGMLNIASEGRMEDVQELYEDICRQEA